MGDTKISALTALTAVATDDALPVVDTDASTTKKITVDNLFRGVTPQYQTTGFTVAGGTTSKTLTVSGDATVDQSVAVASSPTHAGMTLTAFSGAVSASAGVLSAGTLSAANGGTGQSSYTVGDIPYASGASSISKLAAVANGSWLASAGVTTAPAYQTKTFFDARDYADFATAVSTISTTEGTLVISTSLSVAGDVTVPATLGLRFERGGELAVATTKTVTINGPVEAGSFKIFSLTGSGAVAFGPSSVDYVLPQWWADNSVPGTTDMTTAIQAAFNAYESIKLDGKYLFSSSLSVSDRKHIFGYESRAVGTGNYPKASLIKASALNAPGIIITGSGATLSGFLLDGVAGNGDNGINILATRVILRDVTVFNQGGVGIRIGDDAGTSNCNAFTLEDVIIRYSGSHGLYLNSNSAGNPDANAGGIINLISDNNTGDGVRVYNAWYNTFVNVLVQSNGGWGVNLSADAKWNTFSGGDFNEGSVSGTINDGGSWNYVFGGSDGIDLKTTPPDNLVSNSGVSVWSNSDDNQGVGTMPYDGGAVADLVVGETVTGASGATGKVIWYSVTGGTFGGSNKAGTMYLGACSGRFNDDETVTGATSGGTVVVNAPNSAVGVDRYVRNGEFETSTDGWAAVDCTHASVAGGQYGNCLEITRTGGSVQKATQSIAATIGKLFLLSLYVKSGTSGNESFYAYNNNTGTVYFAGTSSASWVKYSAVFRSAGTVTLQVVKNSATAGTMLFDEVSCYEITPGCTAADALGPDGWAKGTDVDLYRQHDDASCTKAGSYYSLKVVPSAATGEVVLPVSATLTEIVERSSYQKVTVGMWVLAYAANNARIAVYDTAYHYSAYHTGGGAWEWLTLTVGLEGTQTSFQVKLLTNAVNVDGTSVVYASHFQVSLVPHLYSNQYRPIKNEFIYTDKPIALTSLTATTSKADATITPIEESSGKIPRNVDALLIKAYCKDSAAGDGVGCDFQTSSGVENGLSIDTQVNNIRVQGQGWVKCDANGNFYFDHRGSGASALTVNAAVIGVMTR